LVLSAKKISFILWPAERVNRVEKRVLEITLSGEDQTESLGRELALWLKPGDVVALHGELGAGKTCLVRGLVKGLGLEESQVASPSFSLINEYTGPVPIFHIDCYRLQSSEEIEELGLEEYMEGPGITVIEWAERISDLAEDRLEVHFSILGETKRRVRIEALGTVAGREIKIDF
jgi:tRNA threonylcarbamoyladenosine biosynthesis protein TsaE